MCRPDVPRHPVRLQQLASQGQIDLNSVQVLAVLVVADRGGVGPAPGTLDAEEQLVDCGQTVVTRLDGRFRLALQQPALRDLVGEVLVHAVEHGRPRPDGRKLLGSEAAARGVLQGYSARVRTPPMLTMSS